MRKQIELTIMMAPEPGTPRQVFAEQVTRHFAIHDNASESMGWRYMVTHIPSGWGCVTKATKREARLAAKAFESVAADWEHVRKRDDELLKPYLSELRQIAQGG